MQDIFGDGRMIFASGENVRMGYYQPQEGLEKANLRLEESILSFVLTGQKWLYHSSGKLDISSGEGFFMAKGSYLQTERPVDRAHGHASLIIRLSDEFLTSFRNICPADESLLMVAITETAVRLNPDAMVSALVTQLAGYFDAPGEKSRVEAILPLKIRELLMLLMTDPANAGLRALLYHGASQPENPLSVLMEAHFREVLSVDQFAFLAGFSLSYFKRKFESAYMMPPRRWIQQRRLKEAYDLLGDGSRNVTEVCYAVGFEHLPHFVQLFKQRYQVTPKQRQLREMAGA